MLAADQAQEYGLTTPALSADCVERLRPLLLAVATAANPLDLTPSTAFRAEALGRLPAALDVFAAEPQIHSLMVIAGSLASRAREIIDVIRALHDRMDKPVCVVWPSPPSGVIAEFARSGIPAFLDPARGMRALGRLVEYHALASRPSRPAEHAVPSSSGAAWCPSADPTP